MISWILIITLAYFFFSLSALADKVFLAGAPKPISYTFYVGFSGLFMAILIPFTNFSLPSMNLFFWILAEAIVFILGLYVAYTAVEKFDISRVVTTIGAIQPLAVLVLTYLFFEVVITNRNVVAFILLLLGSLMISWERKSVKGFSYIWLTSLAAILFALDYIFSKIVYLSGPFLSGFIQMRVLAGILVLLLLFSAKNRREIFNKKNIKSGKADMAFLGGQLTGGIATFLQNYAIAITPVAFLPLLNSMRGIQYVFLFLIVIFFSLFFPAVVKEKISKKIVIKKALAIVIIGIGLALLI